MYQELQKDNKVLYYHGDRVRKPMVLELARPNWLHSGNSLAVRGELCGLVIMLVNGKSTALNA